MRFKIYNVNENEMIGIDGGVKGWGILGGNYLIVACVGITILALYTAPETAFGVENGVNWIYESCQ